MKSDLKRLNEEQRQEDKLEENVTVLRVKDDRTLDQPRAHQGGADGHERDSGEQ